MLYQLTVFYMKPHFSAYNYCMTTTKWPADFVGATADFRSSSFRRHHLLIFYVGPLEYIPNMRNNFRDTKIFWQQHT